MRFETVVTTTMTHVMAVEANDVFEAQAKSLAQLTDRPPDKVDTKIEIEVGNG